MSTQPKSVLQEPHIRFQAHRKRHQPCISCDFLFTASPNPAYPITNNSTNPVKIFLKIHRSEPKVKTVAKDHTVWVSNPLRFSLAFQRSEWETKLASPHLPSRNQVIWELLSGAFRGNMFHPRKSMQGPEHLLHLHSLCLQSNLSCQRPGDRHQRKCWMMMDGWKEKETDSSITSRIHLAQKGEEMPQPYFSF